MDFYLQPPAPLDILVIHVQWIQCNETRSAGKSTLFLCSLGDWTGGWYQKQPEDKLHVTQVNQNGMLELLCAADHGLA